MALSLGAILVYIAMFFSLHPSLGLGVAPLSLIPVAVMAWLFGLRGGLVAGLLITGVNILLIFLLPRAATLFGDVGDGRVGILSIDPSYKGCS